MGLRCPQYTTGYKKKRKNKRKFPSTKKVNRSGYRKFGMKRMTQV